jgi:hypothetical protein
MSYESQMLAQFAMPARQQVERALLCTLLKYNGVVKEFSSGEEIVSELADGFGLNRRQRSASLHTIYRKQNRPKRALLWHRLLFRAADSLAKQDMVSRPTQTLHLTKKREWMLTEKGLDAALRICDVRPMRKDCLQTKSFEVQKIVKKLNEAPPKRKDYDPFDRSKKVIHTTKEFVLRGRGFRQAVTEAYRYKCSVCGLKIKSPDSITWEVEAAHIVPHRSFGRDDICNGIALCHLHHWAFDVGWFTLLDDYRVHICTLIEDLPGDWARIGDYELFEALRRKSVRIDLPNRSAIHPHPNAMRWHRENIFFQAQRPTGVIK